jgi:putative GTP pyrophosphokinase
MKEVIVEEFKQSKSTLDLFRDRIHNLLQDLFTHSNIRIHQISCRTKELESLSKKIDSKFGKYKKLQYITDLVGIRIITYLESEVDNVAELIEKEFIKDPENSIDKRILKADQFGYRSLHIVVALNKSRAALTEYESYKDLKCEIQIRSILQHAWAEIEHDLGYKGKSAIPTSYARTFNRISALLETADNEFDRLKKELEQYEEDVPMLIQQNSEAVSIDQASVKYFVQTNPIMVKARNIIQEITNANFTVASNYSPMLNRLELFNIETIGDLEITVEENKEVFFSFIRVFLKNDKYENLPDNLPLFYFEHFLAGKNQNKKFLKTYLNYKSSLLGGEGNFIDTYKEAVEYHEKNGS